MSVANDPENYFQTTSSISESARKAAKAKGNAGDPIRLGSKILAIAPDPASEDHVYIAEAAGNVTRVDLKSKATSRTFTGPETPLTSLAFSTCPYSSTRTSQSYIVFAGSWDKSIWSWDTSTRKSLRRYADGHSDFVKSVLVFRPRDGAGASFESDVLISGGADAKIILWGVDTGTKFHVLSGHDRSIGTLAIDPLPTFPQSNDQNSRAGVANVSLFSAGSESTIRRWWIALPKPMSGSGSSLEAKKAGLNENIASRDVTAVSAVQRPEIEIHDTSIAMVRFDMDGDLWTASADRSARCLMRKDPEDGTEVSWEEQERFDHPDFVTDVLVDDIGGWIVTACRDEEIRVWEKASGKLYHTFSGHFEEVTGLLLLRRTLVSVSIDATIREWSLDSQDLETSKREAKEGTTDEAMEEKPIESLMTEEEEKELAALMEGGDE